MGLAFRSIKLLDIGYTTIIFLFVGAILGTLLNRLATHLLKDKDPEEESTHRLILNISIHAALVGMFMYITRNVAELFPSPFEGVYGFEHKRLKELQGGFINTFIYVQTQTNLLNNLKELLSRF